MVSFIKNKILNHPVKKIYNLVADVKKYPEFLPWCRDITIKKKTKIILGLIKIASSIEETIDEIQIRIEKALNHIDLNRLIAAPDCGLGHLPRNLAKKKLKTMVEAVKKY